MHGMENFKIKVQNNQAKYNCLFYKEIKYIFPLKCIDIIGRLREKKENSQRHWFEIPKFPV
jgi:hypothetical protein